MTEKVSLAVNGAPIQLDYFVEKFIDQTVGGMVAALEGAGRIGKLDLSIGEGGAVTVNLNNAQVPVNPFVTKIFRNTIVGLVSTLKGVSEVKTLQLTIAR